MLIEDHVALLIEGVQREMEAADLDACQLALAMDGEVLVNETFGSATADSRFLLMSSTKPLLASVVWQLIGEGELDPALPVTTWWPEFGRHGKEAVTLEQLMVHTAGLPNAPLSHAAWFDREVRVAEMEEWTLDWAPGTQYAYHGLSAHWVLAELVERKDGLVYRDALRRRVLDPLGLDRIELGVPLDRQGDVQELTHVGAPPTPIEVAELLGLPAEALSQMPATPSAPTVADSTLTDLRRPDVLAVGVPGGGAVSDAASYARFYQHLLHDPTGLWDADVLHDAKTNVRNMHRDMLGRAAFRTLGFETAGDDEKAGMRIGYGATSPATFGHEGAGGQIAWADPASGLSFVFLTSSLDVNFVRQYRREMAITRLAAACASAVA
jgi:CubicO group peptidase (beta-lactamase class C family)